MRSGTVLLDTNILIDLVDGHPAANMELSRHEDYAISRINWIELLAGNKPEEEPLLREVLTMVSVLDLSTEISVRAIHVRRTTRLKLPDAIIYATALTHDLLFLTRNTRDFSEAMLNVRIPYTV